jgi:peptidoglycan/LPS O-acetylase OafA/YrhL
LALLWPTAILFPLTVLAAALVERNVAWPWSRLGFLGDISYSTYLLHFPLQLVIVLLAGSIGFALPLFSISAMALFFAILIGLAWLSYHYFEYPLQELIRGRALKPRKKPSFHPSMAAIDAPDLKETSSQ